ncbi:MAG TPA: trigger factor [Gemmatimonadales bacterium]|nr:trigger factor [Gemmatimonadales bacterium]
MTPTPISVQKTAEDAASKDLRVTVPVERVREAEARAVRYYAQRAKLPGFRPGKAPEAVVRKRFNDAIRQAVLEELLQESWKTALESESLKPIADPAVRNLKFEADAPLEFDLHVDVKPELKLERTGGFTVTRPAAAVDDQQVNEQLDRLREQKAAWIPVEGEKPREGNLVRVEVQPLDGEGAEAAAAESAEPQSYDLVLGQNQTVPELEEKITTLLPGETAEAEITTPQDHPDEARRGQTRRVRVTLREVKRQDLPALDDAFAREVGDFESVEALRRAVREDLEREAAREADAKVRMDLLQQIVEANGVQAPESLVHRLMHAYADMYRIPKEQLHAFEEQFHPVAEQQVRRDLVLEAVLEAHPELKATEEAVDQRIAQMAEARGVPAGQIYTSLQKANRLGELERSITEEQVFQYLLDQNTVSEATS